MQDFDIFVECCFGLQIFLTFFTAYKDPETQEIVNDVWMISKNYLKFCHILHFLNHILGEHL